MKVTLTLDTTVPVTEGAREIVKTLLEAIALVVLVVFIFLQSWRATLIPILTIPVSLVGAFMFFPAVGFSINTLSLLGLVLAVGLVVDDAIVVVEAIEAKIEQGTVAARCGARSDGRGRRRAGRNRAGAVRRLHPGRIHGRHHRLALPAVRADDRVLGPPLGLQRAHAEPGARRAAAAAAKRRDGAQGPARALLRPLQCGFELRDQRLRQRSAACSSANSCWRSRSWSASSCWPAGSARSLPRSFLPDEDQGYFIINVELPEAASLQRTHRGDEEDRRDSEARAGRPLRQRHRRLQHALANEQPSQRSVLLSAEALSGAQNGGAAGRDRSSLR